MHVAHGRAFGEKALLFTDTGNEHRIGETSEDADSTEEAEAFDVILTFTSIESARILQDMINEMLCKWSRASHH